MTEDSSGPYPEQHPGPEQHPDPEQIARLPDATESDTADDTADRDEWPDQAVTEHVANCAHCGQVLASIVDVRAALAALPPVALPTAVADRLEQALAAEAHEKVRGGEPARRRPRLAWLTAAAAAAAVIFGGGLLFPKLAERNPTSGADTAARSTAERPGSGAPELGDGGATELTGPGFASGGEGDAARLPGLVRALAAARQLAPMSPGASVPPGSEARVADAREPAVARCLAVLGIPPSRLTLASSTRFNGAPATILVLTAGADRVDVRVVRPGCADGATDVQHRLDGLRLR